MKWIAILFSLSMLALMVSCGGETQQTERKTTAERQTASKVEQKPDPRGVGEVTKVELTDPLDQSMIRRGKQISDVKCAACHKYETEERLVGPGYLNVTNRRSPEWIMNMITNVDVMLDEDPVARAMLEECLVRMPNQNISIDEARDILEFLRFNDEEHAGKRDRGVL
ncbi:MAG: cytochrome c [Saprospirales bacterium]|nr:MAG: cytochrome c [Saprospirales bacterium]